MQPVIRMTFKKVFHNPKVHGKILITLEGIAVYLLSVDALKTETLPKKCNY